MLFVSFGRDATDGRGDNVTLNSGECRVPRGWPNLAVICTPRSGEVAYGRNVGRGVHFDELRHDELDETSDEIHQLVTRHSSILLLVPT